MKISHELKEYATNKNMSVEDAKKSGMLEKSTEFSNITIP